MKIAILAAMDKEISLLIGLLNDYEEVEFECSKAYIGKIGNHDIMLSKCGIGKVNASVETGKVLRTFHPDLVINSGVAGGLDASMRIGEVLVADKVVYHDVWCGPGTTYGQADGCPTYFMPSKTAMKSMSTLASINESIRFGLLCSGDKFISSPEEVKEIKSHFSDALGCDMESAAIAQTCFLAGIPFMVVRVMSDMPGGGENIEQYKNFWSDAPSKTFETVSALIRSL